MLLFSGQRTIDVLWFQMRSSRYRLQAGRNKLWRAAFVTSGVVGDNAYVHVYLCMVCTYVPTVLAGPLQGEAWL